MNAGTNENGDFAGRRFEKKVNPDQEHNANYPGYDANAQIVIASAKRLTTKSAWTLAATCPYCEGLHKHGGGIGETPMFGHRVAHCGKGGYQLVPGGAA